MSEYTYKNALKKAKEIKESVEKEYKLSASTPVYYICRYILNPKDKVEKINIGKASDSQGDYISNQIYKSSYKDMATRLVKFVNTKGYLPNYVTWNNKKVKVGDYVYMFSRILVYFDKNGELPSKAECNSKAFTKPTEYPSKVYGLWVKYIKTKPKYLDDVCDYVKAHFNYQFYYDDQKSNEEVLKTKAGNCTDLLQMLSNMAEAMDYEFKIIHTQCRQSGVGHVYGMFRKKSGGEWFIRDIACIADESRYCVWCQVPNNGNQIAINPYWFMQNRNR